MSFHLHLDTESVKHVPFGKPVFALPETSVRDVLREMKSAQRGSVLIRENDRLVGIFTERDALRVMIGEKNFDTPIREFMATEPVTVLATDTVSRAIQLMSRGGYRRLPVLDEAGTPIGIIKVSQIVHYIVEHFPEFVYNLPPTPHHVTQEREGA